MLELARRGTDWLRSSPLLAHKSLESYRVFLYIYISYIYIYTQMRGGGVYPGIYRALSV